MITNEDATWPELLREPAAGDHFVQIWDDEEFLCEAAAEYIGTGLRRREAAIVVARPSHQAAFVERMEADGVAARAALRRGQLVLLDAGEALARFTPGGMPDWQSFHELAGGLIAKLRLRYPAVRVFGEMVDVLWQSGQRAAAMRLEEFWTDLARLQTFSLLCAYRMDNLDAAAYRGPLECVCKGHTHLIPTRDYHGFNDVVTKASEEVLDNPLAQMLLSLSERHRPETAMPQGQATLIWLQHNMPRTAEKVLAQVRARTTV